MAARRNPADRAERHQGELEAAYILFLVWELAAVPLRLFLESVRTGSVRPITESDEFLAALRRLSARSQPPVTGSHLTAYRSGAEEVRGLSENEIRRRARRFAQAVGAPRAARLIQAVDSKNRAAIRAAIRGASRRYLRDPRVDYLRQLSAEVKEMIGLTPKQAIYLRNARLRLEQGGMPEANIREILSSKADRYKTLRSKQIADRAITEAIGYGRHRALEEAVSLGDVPPSVKKAWKDQGDDRVRPLHRAQTVVGPIPLDQVYEYHGVQHPPSPDFGCRCWEVFIYPNEPQEAE